MSHKTGNIWALHYWRLGRWRE